MTADTPKVSPSSWCAYRADSSKPDVGWPAATQKVVSNRRGIVKSDDKAYRPQYAVFLVESLGVKIKV